MKRTHILCAATLLALGVTFALRSTHANNDEKENPTDKVEQLSNQLELIERIDALEKRLARLEGNDQPIRQADNEEPRFSPQQLASRTPLEYVPIPATDEGKFPSFVELLQTVPKSMPHPVPIGDDDDEGDDTRYRGGARIYMHCITPKYEFQAPRTAQR